MGVSDVFSKRGKKPHDVFQYETLPEPLRNQIVILISDAFVDDWDYQREPPFQVRQTLSKQVVETLRREHGLLRLNDRRWMFDELVSYVLAATSTERVLDAVELSFRAIVRTRRTLASFHVDAAALVNELNVRFREHAVGYQFEGGNIISLNNALLHADAVQPALHLLSDRLYAGPDEEIRKAFEHYRKGNDKECLNECLKAFESTMKVICDKRGWAYKKGEATASALIQVILDKGLLPNHNQTQLHAIKSQLSSGIPTTRNKLGGHGQGGEVTEAPDHVARYMLHITAATILMLVESEQALP